jgi:hypothetical protein
VNPSNSVPPWVQTRLQFRVESFSLIDKPRHELDSLEFMKQVRIEGNVHKARPTAGGEEPTTLQISSLESVLEKDDGGGGGIRVCSSVSSIVGGFRSPQPSPAQAPKGQKTAGACACPDLCDSTSWRVDDDGSPLRG